MSLLKLTEPEEAEGDLAEVYSGLESSIGFVPNGYKLLGVSIDVLNRQLSYGEWVFKHPTLSAKFTAISRLLISQDVGCEYCVDVNSAMLQNNHGVSAEQIVALKADINAVPLEPRETALMIFVFNTTKDSLSVSEAEIKSLKNHGWADHEIVDALFMGTQQVAIDTLLNAFKVENDIGK
jgi:uncharacterized peroxidase-related enzyme